MRLEELIESGNTLWNKTVVPLDMKIRTQLTSPAFFVAADMIKNILAYYDQVRNVINNSLRRASGIKDRAGINEYVLATAEAGLADMQYYKNALGARGVVSSAIDENIGYLEKAINDARTLQKSIVASSTA